MIQQAKQPIRQLTLLLLWMSYSSGCVTVMAYSSAIKAAIAQFLCP